MWLADRVYGRHRHFFGTLNAHKVMAEGKPSSAGKYNETPSGHKQRIDISGDNNREHFRVCGGNCGLWPEHRHRFHLQFTGQRSGLRRFKRLIDIFFRQGCATVAADLRRTERIVSRFGCRDQPIHCGERL